MKPLDLYLGSFRGTKSLFKKYFPLTLLREGVKGIGYISEGGFNGMLTAVLWLINPISLKIERLADSTPWLTGGVIGGKI